MNSDGAALPENNLIKKTDPMLSGLIIFLALGSGISAFLLSCFYNGSYVQFVTQLPFIAARTLQSALLLLRFAALLTCGAAIFLKLPGKILVLGTLILATAGSDLLQIITEYSFFGR